MRFPKQFTANLAPPCERFGFDFAYDYNDMMQNALICFNDSDTILPVVVNAGSFSVNGYYQYGEGSFVGPANPRYFHANMRHFPRVGLSEWRRSRTPAFPHAAAGNPKLNH
jgi:hypothetical protein